MKTLFHTCRRLLLPTLLLVAGAASGQVEPTLPVSADPGRARYAPSAAERAQHRGLTALALPFFDDFTTPLEGLPKTQNWVPTGGALVSNRLALRPLTRGAATLDGLKANGQSYSGTVTSNYGRIDSLVSQPINLSGLTASDQVALSFAWQAGSIVGVLNRNTGSTPVQLELFVRTDAGIWQSVWVQRGNRQRTAFRQQVILLSQPEYLHANFQFMFVATGNTSDNSDGWSVDYILLDRGRSRGLADTTFADIATSAGVIGQTVSGGMASPLGRFSAMPVWQFNAATPAGREFNPQLGVTLSNLNAGVLPIPIDVLGTVRVLPASAPLGNWLQISRPLPVNPRQNNVTGPADLPSIPRTSDAKTLRYTMALNTLETLPRTLANDTIFRDVELNDYYAYDDGTAENITQLVPYNTGQAAAFAYRIDLNQPDRVRGLRLYPVFTASDRASRNVTINVWQDAAGQPGTLLASKAAVIPNPLPANGQYFEISFDLPVPVSGSFYVGYSQPSQGRNLHYGLDLNSTFPAGYLWRRDNNGAWNTTSFGPSGSLMMRPVMNNNTSTATASAREAAAFSVYPNPAHGTVTVAGPGFARAAVLDAVGRTVWEQPGASAGRTTLALPALPAGAYTLRLTLADGRTVGRRLLLE
ncbi:T9SS type A sorting domain-containing protein [Hymenobacter sp. BT664]|uniref:T9SS type A sorting domain-containing protein n=1 Tax=Hymenobacter montanus TaxID=2771359 RepID=A0A927BGE0_9BACT|nr:T9SS type A sorting domain-containing protein [Hymenobacter montanus]MBD2769966.1 T9SS type A sorting domain-containing protein [Hymenobacter montanus]